MFMGGLSKAGFGVEIRGRAVGPGSLDVARCVAERLGLAETKESSLAWNENGFTSVKLRSLLQLAVFAGRATFRVRKPRCPCVETSHGQTAQ